MIRRMLAPRLRPVMARTLSLNARRLYLAHQPTSGFEPVAEEVKPLPRFATVAEPRLVRMQPQAIVCDPRHRPAQGCFRLLRRPAQNHEVVCIAHHPIAAFRHQAIQRVQIDVRQQRGDHRPLRRSRRRAPMLHLLHDAVAQAAFDQGQNASVADLLRHLHHEPIVRDRVEEHHHTLPISVTFHVR